MGFIGGAHGNGRGWPRECLPLLLELLLGDEGDGDREPLPEPEPVSETKSKLCREFLPLPSSSGRGHGLRGWLPSYKPVVGFCPFLLSFLLCHQGIFKTAMVADWKWLN